MPRGLVGEVRQRRLRLTVAAGQYQGLGESVVPESTEVESRWVQHAGAVGVCVLEHVGPVCGLVKKCCYKGR